MRISPSLKPKKRYVVFEILCEKKFSTSEIQKAVDSALIQFLGEFGVAKATPLFIKEKCKDNKFMLKVAHTEVDLCKSAVILIKKIKNNSVIIQSITTSGTIKKAGTYL